MYWTTRVIKKLVSRKTTKEQAIHELEVLLDNSVDMKDRKMAHDWIEQLEQELGITK